MIRDFYERKDEFPILRMIDSGAELSDCELIGALLDGISPLYDSRHTAKLLLDRYGSLAAVCAAPSGELSDTEGVGIRGAQLLKVCGAAVANILSENSSDGKRRLYTHDELVDYLRPYFLNEKTEKLYLLTLNSKYKVLGLKLMAQGDSKQLVFDKKLLIDEAVRRGAAFVVLAHNHFTSILPSAQDVILTNDIYELLKHLDIELYDHIIFCENKTKSMRKSGYFKSADSTFSETL